MSTAEVPEHFVSARSVDEDSERRRRRSCQILLHQLGALLLTVLTLHARTVLLRRRCDDTQVTRHVSRGTALVALGDLLLSPVVGRLSDRFGRRMLMLMLPAAPRL